MRVAEGRRLAGPEAGGRAPPGGRVEWAQPGAADLAKSGKRRRGAVKRGW